MLESCPLITPENPLVVLLCQEGWDNELEYVLSITDTAYFVVVKLLGNIIE